MAGERSGYEGPGGFEVDFAVLGKEGREGGFFGEGAGWIVGWGKWLDLGLGLADCNEIIRKQEPSRPGRLDALNAI